MIEGVSLELLKCCMRAFDEVKFKMDGDLKDNDSTCWESTYQIYADELRDILDKTAKRFGQCDAETVQACNDLGGHFLEHGNGKSKEEQLETPLAPSRTAWLWRESGGGFVRLIFSPALAADIGLTETISFVGNIPQKTIGGPRAVRLMSEQPEPFEPVAYLIECEYLASVIHVAGDRDPLKTYKQHREVSFNKDRRPYSPEIRDVKITPLSPSSRRQ